MPRRFTNFNYKFDQNTGNSQILLYEPGIFPIPFSSPPSSEVSGQILQFWSRCFFPEARDTFADGPDTYYYSNKSIKIILKIESKEIDLINFVPWASGAPYYEDFRARFSPNLPFQLGENAQIFAQLEDLGDGLLSDPESIDLWGCCAEEWGFEGGI